MEGEERWDLEFKKSYRHISVNNVLKHNPEDKRTRRILQYSYSCQFHMDFSFRYIHLYLKQMNTTDVIIEFDFDFIQYHLCIIKY